MDFIKLIDLAEELGCTDNRLRYQARYGRIPEPELVLGVRVYRNEIAEEIREFFRGRKPWARKKD